MNKSTKRPNQRPTQQKITTIHAQTNKKLVTKKLVTIRP